MKLSEHLDLSGVTRSDMAKRKGLSNMPTPEHLEKNAKQLTLQEALKKKKSMLIAQYLR